MPPYVLGRVSATQGVVATAIVPFGAIAGGLVGEALGLRVVVAEAAAGTTTAMLMLLLSPLSSRLDLPSMTEAGTDHDGSDTHAPHASGAAVRI